MRKRSRLILIIFLGFLAALFLSANYILNQLLKNRLESLIQQQEDRIYDYSFDNVEIGFIKGYVVLTGLELKPRNAILDSLNKLGESKPQILHVKLDEFRISGIESWRFLLENEIQISSISLIHPSVKMYNYPRTDKAEKKKTSSNQDVAEDIILPNFKFAHIDRFILSDANFNVFNVGTDTMSSVSFDTASIEIIGIHMDSSLIKSGQFVSQEQTLINLKNFNVYSIPNYTLHLEEMYNEKDGNVLHFIDFKFSPTLDKYAFMKQQEFETDWFDIEVDEVILKGYDLEEIQTGGKVEIDSIALIAPDIELYRDKRLPDPEGKYKALPARAIRNIPIEFTVGHLALSDGQLSYLEWEEQGKAPGTVSLSGIQVNATNISSDSVKLAENDTLWLQAEASFSKTGKLTMDFQTFLLDETDRFIVQGRLASLPFDEINQISEHMGFIRFNEGILNYADVFIDANDDRAIGTIDMDYSGLKDIQILRNVNELNKKKKKTKKGKDKTEKRFMSAIANAYVSSEYNPDSYYYRQGKIKIQRNQEKSIFNYLVKSILDGIKSSMLGTHQRAKKKKKKKKKD